MLLLKGWQPSLLWCCLVVPQNSGERHWEHWGAFDFSILAVGFANLEPSLQRLQTKLQMTVLKIGVYLCWKSPSLAGLFFVWYSIRKSWAQAVRVLASSRELVWSRSRRGEWREVLEDSKAGKLFNPLALSSCLFKELGNSPSICSAGRCHPKLTTFSTSRQKASPFIACSDNFCQTFVKRVRHADRSLWWNKGDISKQEGWEDT